MVVVSFMVALPFSLSCAWIDRIIGLENVTVEVVMARAPDGSDMFEVVRFHSPSAGAQEPAPAANRPGLRHIAFTVDDVRGVVDRVREAGWETVGEIVDFENMFLLCYVRGPEGLIVELARPQPCFGHLTSISPAAATVPLRADTRGSGSGCRRSSLPGASFESQAGPRALVRQEWTKTRWPCGSGGGERREDPPVCGQVVERHAGW